MEQKIENLSLLLIKIGTFFILLTPLIIYRPVSYPTIFPKTIFFRIIVEVIFIFYLLLILLKRKVYLPKLSPLFLGIIIFVGILTISSIFGINPYRSFWGTAERSEGLITYLHLLLFFIILTAVFQKKNDWSWILKSAVFLSFLVGLSAIFQKLKIYSFFSIDPSRPSGVLGNPDFVPGYLIFGIFLAIFFAYQKKNWQGKVLYGTISLFNIFVLLMTKTRSGWIGILCGFIFLLIFIFYQKKFLILRKIILFLILIGLLAIFLAVLNQNKPFISENPYFNRFLSIFEYKETLNTRFIPWKISLEGFKDRPLFGWGLESYNFVYDKYFKTDYLPTFPEGGGFDRVHNKILDLLIEAGILGALSYLSIFVLIFYYLFKYMPSKMPEAILDRKDNSNSLASPIFASLFIAYFVWNLFVFDTLSTHISFFLILAFLNSSISSLPEFSKAGKRAILSGKLSDSRDKKKEEKLELKSDSFFAGLGYKKLFFFSGFLIFIIFAIYQVNLKPFFANAHFVKGFYLIGKDCQTASENFQKSFKYNTYLNQEFSLLGAQSSFSALERIKDRKCKESIPNDLILFRESLKKAIESPNIKYAVSLRILGRLNTNLYLLTGNLQYLEEGEEILLRAENFKSQAPLVYQALGEIRIWQGKEKEGIDFYKKALSLNLNLTTLIEFHKKLAMAYQEVGENEKEKKELNRALKLSYLNNNPDLYIILRLANLYLKENDLDSFNQLCQESIKEYNRVIDTIKDLGHQPYVSLATIYAKMGEKEKAKETIQRILEKAPYLESTVKEMLEVIEQSN